MAHGSKPGFWNSPFFLQILHALLPVKCSSCEEDLWDDPIPFFCARCWATIQPINGPACARCHYPFTSSVALQFSPDHTCSNCRLHPPAYTRAWAPFPYQTPLKEAIGLFKYQGKVSLAHPLADLLLAALGSLPPIDLILPVPLHPKRLREREYNQSLLLTNRLSQNLNIPLSYTNLIRIRNTPPQISLKRKDRLKNLRGSFQVYQPELIAKKNLLLIDDVLTTGTTVNECARTLRKAGSGHVYVATLARMV